MHWTSFALNVFALNVYWTQQFSVHWRAMNTTVVSTRVQSLIHLQQFLSNLCSSVHYNTFAPFSLGLNLWDKVFISNWCSCLQRFCLPVFFFLYSILCCPIPIQRTDWMRSENYVAYIYSNNNSKFIQLKTWILIDIWYISISVTVIVLHW